MTFIYIEIKPNKDILSRYCWQIHMKIFPQLDIQQTTPPTAPEEPPIADSTSFDTSMKYCLVELMGNFKW